MYRYNDQSKHTDVISVYVAIGLKRSSVVQMMKTLENLIVNMSIKMQIQELFHAFWIIWDTYSCHTHSYIDLFCR